MKLIPKYYKHLQCFVYLFSVNLKDEWAIFCFRVNFFGALCYRLNDIRLALILSA